MTIYFWFNYFFIAQLFFFFLGPPESQVENNFSLRTPTLSACQYGGEFGWNEVRRGREREEGREREKTLFNFFSFFFLLFRCLSLASILIWKIVLFSSLLRFSLFLLFPPSLFPFGSSFFFFFFFFLIDVQ